MPATSIYSRFDGIVAWQACLDPPSPRAENIAVVGSHFGFGHNPAVMWAVADRLAQPLGAWAPFRPPRALRPLYPPVDTPPDGLRDLATGTLVELIDTRRCRANTELRTRTCPRRDAATSYAKDKPSHAISSNSG